MATGFPEAVPGRPRMTGATRQGYRRSMGDSDRILIAYGSKHGATAEIADAIGTTLREAGWAADVVPAGHVTSIDPYVAAVVGSAVYMGHWRSDAAHLLKRPELRERPVWLFSSGPVGEDSDDPASERWTKPERIQKLAAAIGVRDHAVFGGMVADDEGFMRKRMALGIPPEARDRRDWDEISAWATSIATALDGAPETAGGSPNTSPAAD
jgi:menaquinone-dependent protoporphyrinogen oxidase